MVKRGLFYDFRIIHAKTEAITCIASKEHDNLKDTGCQTLMLFWRLEIFRWILPCNLSSRAQKLPKLTQTLGGGIAMYSTFWIGIYGLLSVLISDFSSFNSIFVLFQWQICLVSDEICLVSSLALSGVSLNGDCMTVNWGSVAMEQRMNGYSVEYGSFFISELNCYPKVPWEVSWLPFSIDTYFLRLLQ